MSLWWRLLMAIPFVVIVWASWVRSLHDEQIVRPQLTVAQRDMLRIVHWRRNAERRSQHPGEAQARAAAAAPGVVASQAASGAAIESTPPRPSCPSTRKPFHTILTATAQGYQQWQCRVMYMHWKKQRDNDRAGACTELTGFTRLVAHGHGDPDGLEKEIPSYFVNEYGQADLARFHGYRVINRPYSMTQFLKTAYYKAIAEDYIYIAETDHILLQPLPNLAKRGSPMAYVFGYMGRNPAHAPIIARAWPEGGTDGWKTVQPIGPSPVVIHRLDLEAISADWEAIAVALKTNREADSRLGWVIEMWGYSIAAAKIGLKHQEFPDFQVEPGGNSAPQQLRGFPLRYWVFHYTYQFEYMLDGTPCRPWTIGEFSLDKRHFDTPPVAPLPQPPAKANAAAFYLTNAFNEAMANISTWPAHQPPPGSNVRQAQTVYGRRRLDWFGRHQNGFATELQTMPLIKSLADSYWSCQEAKEGKTSKLTLDNNGNAKGFGRSGRWGSMNDPTLGDACPVYSCLYIDAGGQFEAKVEAGEQQLTVLSHRTLAVEWTCKRDPSPTLVEKAKLSLGF